jgi:hypothetical protein
MVNIRNILHVSNNLLIFCMNLDNLSYNNFLSSDPPSAPGTPKVIEVGGDFVNLSWEKPTSDGGARIQGYWIDKREAGTVAWQRVNLSICITPQINISNLIEGRQYEFQVFAQNEAGLSPASTNSTSVKIKDPKGKY